MEQMEQEELFRWIFIALLAATLFISGYFRRKARKVGEVIPRAREGMGMVSLRVLFTAPILLAFLAYMIDPDWMDWSSLPLPAGLRWAGAAAASGMLLLLLWVVSTLGRNISETVLTKKDQTLVTAGPYAFVRHPLYSVGIAMIFSLGLLAANWLMIAMAFLVIIGIVFVVIPREEAQLIGKFGSAYRAYMKQTGRLLPRLGAKP